MTREDKIRNEYIRRTARIAKLGEKIRGARLRWYGHVKRREAEYVGRRTLEIEVPGRRKRGKAEEEVVGCGAGGYGEYGCCGGGCGSEDGMFAIARFIGGLSFRGF